MTFLHKLAKRLALIAAVAALPSFIASCGEPTSHDFLGPDPNKPSPSGAYIGLSVTPRDPTMFLGDSLRLEAHGWLSNGLSQLASVAWSASGGSIGTNGWYRPTVTGAFRVRAVSTTVASLSDSTLVIVLNPFGITRLDVTPGTASLAAGSRQQFTAVAIMGDGSRMQPTVGWRATGGTISESGLFTAGTITGAYSVTALLGDGAVQGRASGTVVPPVLTRLALEPGDVMLESSAARQFTVSATWSDGATALPALTWSATGGAISGSGVYTAGATAGTYRVIVSSPSNGKADTSNVTILPRVVQLRVVPLSAALALGATQVVKAYALRSDGTEGPVGAEWSAQGGTISLNGTYTAGSVPGSYAVAGTLRALNGQVFSDTAQFQVGGGTATLTQLSVRPDTTIPAGSTAQFSVAGSWSDGSSTIPAVNWSATGGSISAAGLYTAGGVSGTYRVIATQQNGTRADTASVVVTAAPVAEISTFTISPSSDILAAGQSRQFSATLNWSDGQVHPANITWIAAGGTITQDGLYTAGSVAGTFLVIATCSCGVADTASVNIPAGSSAQVTLTKVILSPSSVQLAPGGSQIFTVSGVWSDGATSPPPVSFVAEGGSITQAGVYIAANVSGTYRVIATQAGGGLADTSLVTISGGGPTLTQLVLNPSSVVVPPGGTQAFTVAASWSDGSSTVPPITYTATGGSITAGGLYTAGSTIGIFRVIATQTGGTKADTSEVTIAVLPTTPVPTVLAELPRAYVNTAYAPPTGRTVNVPAGGNLQTALNNSVCGDEILLAPGATYTGSFSLPPRSCGTNMIHVRTSGTLPPEGVRVTPAGAASFAKIVSANGDAPIRASNGARGFRLIALEVYSTATENIGMIYLGGDGREAWDGQISSVPGYITLDRMYIHGLPHQKSRRCVAVNGVYLAVINSYLSMCQSQDTDAQAVWGASGPGPYKIANNYLEGTGENVMFGGADSPSAEMMPSDIEIRGNLFSKPEEWRLSSEWLIKNLFELKVGKRVLVEGNVFQNSWSAGHTGFAMGFASMNQSGSAPWSQVSDVTFRLNYVRHSGSGINLAATGTANATPAVRYTLTDNVFEDIGRRDLLSDGRMVQVLGSVADVFISHNTFLHTPDGNKNSAVYLAYGADPRATIINNIFTPGQYGVVGDAIGQGTTALAYYMPDGVFLANVFAGPVDWSRPKNNYFVGSVADLWFDSQLRLGSASGLKGRATDGKDPGADIDALLSATANVVP